MSITKFISLFPLLLLLLPNNQQIISLSSYFLSFNLLSSNFISFYYPNIPEEKGFRGGSHALGFSNRYFFACQTKEIKTFFL